MPAVWCSQICTNSMNEVCVTICAPKRNASWFEIKDGINLEDLPRFPQQSWQHEMTSAERQAIAGLYLRAIVDHLKGVHNEPARTYPDSIGNRRLLKALQKQGLLDGTTQRNPSHKNGQICPNTSHRPSKVD